MQHSGTTGRLDSYNEFHLLTFVPDVLETSSCLHVALLVFLRYLAISEPMNFKEIHKKLRYYGITAIWGTSIGIRLLNILTYDTEFYNYYNYYLVIHLFHSIPVLYIIFMQLKMIFVLRTKRKEKKEDAFLSNLGTEDADAIKKRTTHMLQDIVVFLVISYVPYIVWWQYYNVITFNHMVIQDTPRIFRVHFSVPKLTTAEVNFTYLKSISF